jgi:hypothetical protein
MLSYPISPKLLTGFPNGLFPSGFPTKTLLFSINTTCSTYHILLDLTTLLISDKGKSEAPDYALSSILLLNSTISTVLKDYGDLYTPCTHTFNTAHYLTNYITTSIKTNTLVCYLKGHVTYRTAVESLS